jgi:hypothetical protein
LEVFSLVGTFNGTVSVSISTSSPSFERAESALGMDFDSTTNSKGFVSRGGGDGGGGDRGGGRGGARGNLIPVNAESGQGDGEGVLVCFLIIDQILT